MMKIRGYAARKTQQQILHRDTCNIKNSMAIYLSYPCWNLLGKGIRNIMNLRSM